MLIYTVNHVKPPQVLCQIKSGWMRVIVNNLCDMGMAGCLCYHNAKDFDLRE